MRRKIRDHMKELDVKLGMLEYAALEPLLMLELGFAASREVPFKACRSLALYSSPLT